MTSTRLLRLPGAVLAALLVSLPLSLQAQEPDSTRLAELEARLDALTREIERVRLGDEVVRADTSIGGFGLGASKVYQVDRGVSIGGYGEVLYENFAAERENGSPAASSDRFDALRAILYVGYKFNDRLLFNSEIEIEHGNEAFLEFGYIDVLLTETVGLRGGLLLAPLGLVNELHEPPTFLGTERPVTEQRIIPTTWRENGLGLFGGSETLSWRVYVMNSLDGAGFGAAGFRGGRQKGSKALAEDLGVAARMDFVGKPGLILGASGYLGETAQNRELDGEEVAGRIFIWDLHADYKVRGWELRGLVAGATVDDPVSLNALNGLSGSEGIGESMLGGYVEVGYDVLRPTASTHQLLPYARFERVNTQSTVAEGFTADPAHDLSVLSLGAAWRPSTEVVFKLGYQMHSNEARTGVDQLNMQIGWLF